MSQQQLLAHVVACLEDVGVPYMLTGSLVSSALGEPRSTHDIDVVVEIRSDQINAIAKAFPPPNFSFDEVAAKDAILRVDMFQLMEFESGDKVDFWVAKDLPFDRSAFGRRYLGIIVDLQAYLPTAEDLILQKLKWAHEYESERQYRDALGVYELQFSKLDLAYIRQWVKQLRIESTWEQLLAEARPLQS